MKRPSNESELVILLKSNNKAAFEYLYANYSGALYHVICKIVKDDETASDTLQDTFVKIWKSIASYDPAKGALFTWMLNIARNKAIDVYRAKPISVSYLAIEQINGDDGMYAYATLPLFDLHDVKQLVGKLPKESAGLIDLVYIQGFTQEEVSKMLLIPLGTVKSRIRRALALLRNWYEQPELSLQVIPN